MKFGDFVFELFLFFINFSRKSARAQGSPLVGGPLALRPYPARGSAVVGGPGFFSRTLCPF